MIIEESHPYWNMREMVSREPKISALTFSYYVYRPQSLVDERISFDVARGEFLDPEFVRSLMSAGPNSSELAFHSNVTCFDGNVLHIPMVDMSTAKRADLEKMRRYLNIEIFNSFTWFISGRSFHGYGGLPVTHDEWIKYMGLLLLSNERDGEQLVDPRWIGHRLIAGYAALRWTKHTSMYLALPAKLQ